MNGTNNNGKKGFIGMPYWTTAWQLLYLAREWYLSNNKERIIRTY